MRGGNRTIIIPKGTLNSDDINVVVVPPSLQNSSQPLIVKQTKGKKLAAVSLPIWGDELDSSHAGKEQYEREMTRSDEESTNFDFDTTEDFEISDFETSTMCSTSPEGTPNLVHLSTKTVEITNDGPPETFEMVFDAADGVDPNVFETVVEQGVKEEKSFEAFEPLAESSYEDFFPDFNSTAVTPGDFASSMMMGPSMQYPAVRSSPPPRMGCQGSGCGGGRKAAPAQYAQQAFYDPYATMGQPQQRSHRSGKRRGHRSSRHPKQSGCGGGCSGGY